MDKIQKANADYYDKHNLRWSKNRTNSFFHEDRFRKFIKYFRKNYSVLDIGCASGVHVPLFLGIGHDVQYQGIDISKTMLRVAKSRYPQLHFSHGNITDIKTLPKKKFNGFWAAAVFMHVPKSEWPKLLDNLQAIMKSNAIGFLTLPKEMPGPLMKDDYRHFSVFSAVELKKLFKSQGWKILKYGGLAGSNGQPWHWLMVKLP